MDRKEIKLLSITWLGGVLEFYDFIIFAYLASIFGTLFLPSDSPFISLVFGYSILAVAYFARPFGAILFGMVTDRYGRKLILTTTMFLMGLSSLLIAILPTYQQIGIAAPLILIALRILQGLSISGEMASSTTFVAEYVNKQYRGFACSLLYTHTIMGTLLGSLVVLLLTTLMTNENLMQWGWRIPFFIGSSLCFVAWYLRSNISESPIFMQIKAEQKISVKPFSKLFNDYKTPMICSFSIVVLAVTVYNIIFIVFPTELQRYGYSKEMLLSINTIALFTCALSCIINGFLSDKFGRKFILWMSLVFFVVMAIPLYHLIMYQTIIGLILSYLFFALACGSLLALSPLVINEHFPSDIRGSSASLILNMGIAIFGGLTPLFCITMTELLNSNLTTVYYLVALSALTMIILPYFKETRQIDLSNIHQVEKKVLYKH